MREAPGGRMIGAMRRWAVQVQAGWVGGWVVWVVWMGGRQLGRRDYTTNACDLLIHAPAPTPRTTRRSVTAWQSRRRRPSTTAPPAATAVVH